MKPLALTMGDPAGIGGELTVRAWQTLRHKGPSFMVLDDPKRFPGVPVAEVTSAEAASSASDRLISLVIPSAVLIRPPSARPPRENQE